MQKGDIVQITSETHHWYPCLIIVDEVEAWGVQGYALIPEKREEPLGQAFIRLNTSDFERVGQAVVLVER